jgi:hypothetical protein
VKEKIRKEKRNTGFKRGWGNESNEERNPINH